MSRCRRVRRSLPEEWLERFVGGESLRSLGRELGVSHTTLARRLRRPGMDSELREARRRDARRKTARAQSSNERKAEKELRRRARADAQHDRALARWRRSPQPPRRSEKEIWLDQREGPRGLPSKERWSINDELADQAVSVGGGIEDVIEATTLRTRLNVYESIDPQIAVRALRNEKRRRAERQLSAGLRRLEADANLIRRRAAGESLRQLASDYDVHPSTLCRYFKRPQISKALASPPRRTPSKHGPPQQENPWAEQVRAIRCPRHRMPVRVNVQTSSDRETTLLAVFCCEEAKHEALRRLEIDHGLKATVRP